MTAVRNYLRFLGRCASVALVGDWRYYLWVGTLSLICLLGLNAYAKQFVHGLVVTGMHDQVSWGVYIANFTFLVGVAAAAVMLVIPVYIYRNKELHDLVIFGELLAVAAILMCLAFVTVDLGRPDRFLHLVPGIGKFNFPGSMLSWDVIVLNGYLLLNVHICGYLLYCRYRGNQPKKWFYIPFVFIGIVWAVSIHTVTAFLYVGLGGRPFWNSAIVGPRFIASAFAAGPAIIILALQVIRRVTSYQVSGSAPTPHGPLTPSTTGSQRPATPQDLQRLASLVPAFRSLPADAQQQFASQSSILTLPAGSVVVRQGDLGNEAFFVIDGRLSSWRVEHGVTQTLKPLQPGALMGEIASLTGRPRTASVTSDSPVTLLRTTSEGLRTLQQDRRLRGLIASEMSARMVITDRALLTLRSIVQVAMLINLFLLFNELFKEFYTGNLHVASAQYLFFGLHGHSALVPWIWTALACNLVATFLLLLPVTRSLRWLDFACVLAIIGIWIEKGMGLVIPGFVPTPLGELVEYQPTLNETLICLGIWAFGLLCYTVFLRMSVPILTGQLTEANVPRKPWTDSAEHLRDYQHSQSRSPWRQSPARTPTPEAHAHSAHD